METEIDGIGRLASGWETTEWTLRTLTPIWAGGIAKGECAKETKASTLIGSLRYWAEQTCRESRTAVCTGDDWCGKADCGVCGVFGSTECVRAFRIQITGLPYVEDQGGLWSDEFRIKIWTRKGDGRGGQAKQLTGEAIRLFAAKGGFGARTQHGWGQVELLGG